MKKQWNYVEKDGNPKNAALDNMIKALKCVASQDTEGDCYADRENSMHMDDDEHKRIVCGTGETLRDFISGKESLRCPYHQKEYGCCFEDGELYWLKDVAELLEELKSYKEAEGDEEMKKFKEKRMASYVLRSNELIQEGKTKEAAELFGKGLGYYSSNIIHAITPYATADAGLISTVLRHLASEIEEKNPGAKEMREWAETHVEKPELKEIKRIKKPNCK